jgi:tetratricopeptide (TPR) repeat protein
MQRKEEPTTFEKFITSLTSSKEVQIIIVVGAIVFFNALFGNFIWDDKIYITLNPKVYVNVFSQENTFNSVGQYRPVIALYFAVFYKIFNNIAFFFHTFQVSLHIANTILVFLIFKKLLSKKLSFFLALVFLTHPIQVEAVSYIAATGDPLAFFWGATALYLSMEKKVSKKRIFLIFGLILLSLLTKEIGVFFLITILLFRIIFKKEQIGIFFRSGLIISLIYISIRFIAGGTFLEKPLLIPIAKLTLTQRILHIPEIIFYYLKTFFFPLSLAHNQLWIIDNFNFHSLYLPLILVLLFCFGIGILGLNIYKKERNSFRLYIFFLLWFLIGILAYLQIYPLDETVAERWFYFPIVGLLGLIALAIQSVKYNKENIKVMGYVGTTLIVLLSTRTVIRNANWADAFTLYTHDMKIHDNFDIETNLASEYFFAGKYNGAVLHFRKSIEMFPHEGNLYNLGLTFEQMGDREKAMVYYYKALEARNYTQVTHGLSTYERLTWLLLLSDSFKQAKEVSSKGLKDYPQSESLWMNLAISEYRLGDFDQALFAAGKARSLKPNEKTNSLYIQILKRQPLNLVP